MKETVPCGIYDAYDTNDIYNVKELAYLVNSQLARYVEVHNEIFKNTCTFKSLMKNIIGLGKPASYYLELSKKTLDEWFVVRGKVISFRNDRLSSLNYNESNFLNILVEFTTAVKDCIELLVLQQNLYKNKCDGQNVPLARFNDTSSRYSQSIANYRILGKKLNELLVEIYD